MKKQPMRTSLIEDIESELKKDADHIDPDFIDRRIDELYGLDGLSLSKLDDEALGAATRTVLARAAWRRRNTLAKQASKRGVTRWAVAACCAFLFLFSANYVTTLITGACLPAKVGIKICCGTKYCLCDRAKVEKTGPSN
ncbi:MAG: hypothetical protein LBF75_06760 [Treponema sp.]|nr:hypothetical protein [Treponema sp.]